MKSLRDDKSIFVCYIDARHKPYTRMTQASKWVDKSAQDYLDSQTNLRGILMEAKTTQGYIAAPIFRKGIPLRLVLIYGYAMNNQDVSNLLKAVEDAANKVIYDDDRWIDEVIVRRAKRKRDVSSILIVMPVSTSWPTYDKLIAEAHEIAATGMIPKGDK